jgi:hypothetical protein
MAERFMNKFLDMFHKILDDYRTASSQIVSELRAENNRLSQELYNCQQDLHAAHRK